MSKGQPEGDALRHVLLDATEALAASNGIEGVALRAVAVAAGKSTTAIFQHFGSKEGLLLASIEHALAKVAHWHDEWRASLGGLPLTREALAEVIAFYVQSQSTDSAARLCLETLFKSRQLPGVSGLLTEWDCMRRRFWEDLLSRSPYTHLAPILATYTAAEQGFAVSLSSEPRYALLLREAVLGLLDGCHGAHDPNQVTTPAIHWLEQNVVSPETLGGSDPKGTRGPVAAMERLIDRAAATIIEQGISGLNLRRLAAEVDVAPSLIVYHYGDFASFTRAAIWRAMMDDVPDYFDSSQGAAAGRGADRNWLADLERAVVAADGNHPAGFYVNYARILGQVSMLATRQPELRPLILQLRAIEGSGIHHASQTVWPRAFRLGRRTAASFAIWIKGQAILNEGLPPGSQATRASDALATLSILTGA